MKRILLLLPSLVILFLASCGRAENAGPPKDLEGKKTYLRERKAELRSLTKQIEALEEEIYAEDPTLVPKGVDVTYKKVGTDDFENYAQVQATVTADESAYASPQLPGRINSMRFKEGDAISKGQLVAVIDVEDVNSQRAELETAMELARDVYERQKRLWDQNIGSEVQFLKAKNDYERLQKQLETVDVTAAKKNVYAPISGTVDQVMMRQGETASPGMPILSILNTNDLSVTADAPEGLLSKVKMGEKLTVKVPTLNLEFTAPVTRIGKTVDAANRTFEVELRVPRQYRSKLKANLLAQVEVLDFTAEDVVVVSQDNIQQQIDGRRYVFVAEDGQDGEVIAKKHYVETGASFDNKAIIKSGLKAGDRLITNGSRGLTDGQTISLIENPIQ